MRLIIALVLIASPLIAQTTRVVPTQIATIQGAIDASAPGDAVVVLPGTYSENLDFTGKNVTVISSAGAPITVVDAASSGSVVTFDGNGPGTLLDGFTLRNGVGATGTPAAPNGNGGGIHMRMASPMVRNCIITGCVGGDGFPGGSAGAGGIDAAGGSPTLVDCIIESNQGGVTPPTPFSPAGGRGAGGLFFAATAGSIEGCTVRANTGGPGGLHVLNFSGSIIDCDIDSNVGTAGAVGGLMVWNLSAVALAVVDGCTIRSNRSGKMTSFGFAAGVTTFGDVALIDCDILGNIADQDPSALLGGGGGIRMHGTSGSSMHGCRILDNVGGFGVERGGVGGVETLANVHMVNCVVAGNVGGDGGNTGGFILPGMAGPGGARLTFSTAHLLHCTVTDNRGGAGGTNSAGLQALPGAGGISMPTGGPNPANAGIAIIENAVVWGNVDDQGMPYEIFVDPAATIRISSSDVRGGAAGIGNIDAAPAFFDAVNRDYRLTAPSPCRDAADPSLAALVGVDADGDPRTFNGIPDMGADEFYGLAGCGDGAIAGGTFDVLLINGSAGLPDRRVVLPLGAMLTLDVLQPPGNPTPALFLISGFIGVPDSTWLTPLPFGFGTLCFPSTLLTPSFPGAFLLTSSYGPVPGMLTPSTPAPWSLTTIGAPFPFALTFQGLIDEMPATPRLTNGVIVEWR